MGTEEWPQVAVIIVKSSVIHKQALRGVFVKITQSAVFFFLEQGRAVEVVPQLHCHAVAVGAGNEAIFPIVLVGLFFAGGIHNGRDLPRPVILIPGGTALAVGGAGHVARVVVGVIFRAPVRLDDARDPSPGVQVIGGAVLVAVLHPHNVAPGVVGQLLGGPAAGLNMGAVARQIICKLRPALETVQLLEQPAFFVVGVGLEYMAVGPHHRKYTALVIVGVLIPRAIIGLWVILVGPHHLGQVAIAVVEAAGHAAILLDPPDLPVEQVVLHPGPASLVVRDLHQVACLVVGKLRAVVDTGGLVDVGLGNQPVHRVVLPQHLSPGGDFDHVAIFKGGWGLKTTHSGEIT